ncbi:hypothetical protein [Sphingomonas sp.]|jgi:hypothetical protein|uniref:hypothetical protein n=1 Tax=Sphingomonas sp. TaxID=28214 RepID=UPI002E1464E9|nr:hypothetical protein [Sphingomonas sp.]
MRLLALPLIALAACSPAGNDAAPANGVLAEGPETAISNVAATELPTGVAELAEVTVPGMRIAEAERKDRDGRTYYDVEGTRPDGSEVEIDMLVQPDGSLKAVEVQRDIAWEAAPAPVRAAAAATADAFTPERVIESRQVEDGRILYELFAPGKPKDPAMEIAWADGKATLLTERAIH